jgi:hypothetical protein
MQSRIYQEVHVSTYILHGMIYSVHKLIIQVSISNRNISMGFCLFILVNSKYHVEPRYSLDKKNPHLILKCYRMHSPSFCCVLQRWTGKNAIFICHRKRSVTWVEMITWCSTGKMSAAWHRYWFMRCVCFESKDDIYGYKHTQILASTIISSMSLPVWTGIPGSVILLSGNLVSVKYPVKLQTQLPKWSFAASRNIS